MAEVVLTLKNVTKIYGKGEAEVTALHHISLAFGQGEFAAVVGPSGSGRRRFSTSLAALTHNRRGTCVERRTDEIDEQNRARDVSAHTCFLRLPVYNLIPVLTVTENVELPLLIEGNHDKAQIHERARAIITMVGLADKANRYPPSFRVVRSSASPSRAPLSKNRVSSSPTSPLPTSTLMPQAK